MKWEAKPERSIQERIDRTKLILAEQIRHVLADHSLTVNVTVGELLDILETTARK